MGAVALYTENLKVSLESEAKTWKLVFGRALNHKYCQLMEQILSQTEDFSVRLSREVKDLDDVRMAMACLREVRSAEIFIDSSIGPIEESYAMLNKHGIPAPREQVERVDTLRYQWEKLTSLAGQVQSHLITIQPQFKDTLITQIGTFATDTDAFFSDYRDRGPMVDGIPPREASERLQEFQMNFDSIWRRFQTCEDGEELFGLSKTPYPEIERIRRELNLLQKLYGLYNAVMDSIDGYYDILWTEVDVEKINSELLEFQNRCRKLPKVSSGTMSPSGRVNPPPPPRD